MRRGRLQFVGRVIVLFTTYGDRCAFRNYARANGLRVELLDGAGLALTRPDRATP